MSTRSSLFFSFLDRYATLAINLISSMVLARLLTPAELGVYSVTMVLLILLNTTRDMGAGQYLVQEKELTTERVRAVWAMQLGIGMLLACIVLLIAYPAALFYGEPRMTGILLVVALNYVVNPFGSLTHAWLAREMRFDILAPMRFASSLAGALVSIGLARAHFGPISLAWGSVAAILVNASIAVRYRPKAFPWLPGLSELRRVFSFGYQLTASNIISSLSSNAPELLLGKLQDVTAVGLYSRANGLVQMVNRLFVDAVGTVCMSWFAKESREGGTFVNPFLKATSYVTALGWSFCIGVICLAHPVIMAMYGNQWGQAVDISRLLAVTIAFSLPSTLCKTALISVGSVHVAARLTAVSSVLTLACVSIGAFLGLFPLGIGLAVATLFNSALWLRELCQSHELPGRRLFAVLRQSAGPALLSGVGPLAALLLYGPYPREVLMPLLIGALGAGLGFIAGVYVFRHPLKGEFTSLWSKARTFMP